MTDLSPARKTIEEKRSFALDMLNQGSTTKEIKSATSTKFGTAIDGNWLTKVRKNKSKEPKKVKKRLCMRAKTNEIKKRMTKHLVEKGASTKEIMAKVKARFGTSISREDIAEVRADLGKSGPNRKKGGFAFLKRRRMAEKLIAKGLNGDRVISEVRKKFGHGISTRTIADIRAEIASKSRSLKKPKMTQDDVMVLTNQTISSAIQKHVDALVRQMQTEGIDTVTINREGSAVARRTQEIEFIAGGVA